MKLINPLASPFKERYNVCVCFIASTMMVDKNYNLFDKYLQKISLATIAKFGSTERVELFLQNLSESGNIAYAIKIATDNSAPTLSVLELQQLISRDKALAKCVKLSVQLAIDKAEGVLYDRTINGYEELSYNMDGECISRKRKYCSKSLLEYLKANSAKYQTSMKKHKTNAKASSKENAKIAKFTVESYAE